MLQRFTTDYHGALLLVLFIALRLLLSDSATPRLVLPQDSQCACIGRTLTYTCTTVGKGSTLWTGSAFDCTNNWINLRHSLFNDSNRGATGECNDGAIMGQSIGVMDNRYTSQLHVRITADLNNKSIHCDHRPGTETNTIGQSTLTVITGPLPPPSDIHPVRLLQGNLTFQWTSVAPACSSNLDYRINSTSCGNCILSSSSASTTTATCSNLPQPMTTCSFNVRSVVCDQVGELSSPVEIVLKVPGVPHVNIFPVYSDNGKISAAKIVITNNQTIYPYNGFRTPVSSYSVAFSNFTSGTTLNSVHVFPCVGDVCEYLLDVSTYCHSTGSISMAVSATNEFGVGLSSDPIYIKCANNLVKVAYDMDSSTITCTFDDPHNTADKQCIIEYGICKSQQLGQTLEGSSTLEFPNIVTLILPSIDPNRMYCYNVTASNVSCTVIVMGRIGMDRGNTVSVGVIAAAIGVLVVSIVAIIFTVALIIICARCNYKKQTDDDGALLQPAVQWRMFSTRQSTSTVEDKLQLHQLPDICFKQCIVKSDCQLKKFLKEEGLNFWRGCAYYEYHHNLEPNISKDKRLLFMKEKEGLVYSSKLDCDALEGLGCLGENVSPPKGCRLFVQTTGSGTRHLPGGSLLLYDTQKEKSHLTNELTFPKPLLSNWFTLREVDEDCTLKEFQTEHGIVSSKFNIFLEHDGTRGDRDILDVMLVKEGTENQQSTPDLFTWPSVRRTVQEKSQHLEKLLKDWRVFVIEREPFIGTLQLKKGSVVLYGYTNLKHYKEQFHVLKVEKDNMRMSTFVKQKLGFFENGRAFYEFTSEEDFLHFKEVIKVPKSQLKGIDRLFIQPNVSLFYTIPGAPGEECIPQEIQHVRVFVQSTSYGSRCLKAGETILYKMDNEQRHKEVTTQV